MTEGGTYEHTFETKGTYKYYCVPHEMNAMVVLLIASAGCSELFGSKRARARRDTYFG